MKKRILTFSLLLVFAKGVVGQVGIGNTAPRGALDINNPTTYNMGLVLPTNSNVANMINPRGGNVIAGTVMYDSTNDCVRVYKSATNSWSSCLCDNCLGAGSVGNLDCASAVHNGTLTAGNEAGSDVTTKIQYTGATQGFYSGQSVASTGVTGLTANLPLGTFSSTGSGSVTFTITGTPSGRGVASFTVQVGGKTCTFTRNVGDGAIDLRIAFHGTYSIGSAQLSAFNGQLNDTSNYSQFGTYKGVKSVPAPVDITSTLANAGTTGTSLKNSYDIISTGITAMTAASAQKIKDFVNLGGVVILNLDYGGYDTSSIFQAFGNTGTVGTGTVPATSSSTVALSSYFGNTKGIALSGDSTAGRILSSQIPGGSKVVATENAGGVAVWTVPGYGGRVIYIWDEGLFRTSVSGAVDTGQERFDHNLFSYAIDKARGL